MRCIDVFPERRAVENVFTAGGAVHTIPPVANHEKSTAGLSIPTAVRGADPAPNPSDCREYRVDGDLDNRPRAAKG